MSLILECENLTKKYNHNIALDCLNLKFETGRIVGLLGPNGSGKTTLLKLINGLIQPTSGQVLIKGLKPSPETKAIISYLPDRTYLSDWMKVGDCIRLFSNFYSDFDENCAIDMLHNLDIDQKAQMKSLSKGNKEKVQLILVMARKAQLYLLDEPIGGVDPAARDYILKTILNNYHKDAMLLISTHLIQDVEQIFDDIIFINKGKIVLQGAVDEIRSEKGMSIDALFREEFKC